MQPREHYQEAVRWAKFPATVLLATGVVWLLRNYFELDIAAVGELTETGVGIVLALINLLLIPLGSVAAGIGLLFTQRWAIFAAAPLASAALLATTIDKAQRIYVKFAQYRSEQDTAAYGDAVMTILLLLALWAVLGLMVWYIIKTWRHLQSARQWLSQPRSQGAPAASAARRVPYSIDEDEVEEGDVCLLMPEFTGDDDSG